VKTRWYVIPKALWTRCRWWPAGRPAVVNAATSQGTTRRAALLSPGFVKDRAAVSKKTPSLKNEQR
jgi:hypothetical protein